MVVEKISLKEVAKVFLKLGFLGFGGPAVHIAMMHEEVVVKRAWMQETHFLDLVGATNLIPGPNSTEMAIHIGYEKAGWKGLVVAGICFIIPAILLTALLAYAYQIYGQLPAVQPYLYGIKPALIAVIAGAVFSLVQRAIRSVFWALLALLILGAALGGVSELTLLFGAGFLGYVVYIVQKSRSNRLPTFTPLLGLHTAFWNEEYFKIFWVFLKIGALLYGSGYVLFAFLETELVQTGTLSQEVLMDAIAVGQFTPGPVLSTVTFIGYQLHGISGALVATIAIFLPSFVLVILLNPLMKKMRASKGLEAFLDAVNVASVALIAGVCFKMGTEVLVDVRGIGIAVISTIIVFKWKQLNRAFIVFGAAFLGYWLY